MRRLNWRWRTLAALLSTALLLVGWPALTAEAAGGPSIAAGRPAAASSAHGGYIAAHITDGDPSTYWESAGGTFPQWAQTDLGTTTRIDQVVLRLPAAWESRDQTLSVQGSVDGTSFATLVNQATYTFGQSAGNAVTIAFPATQTRFVRIQITANTGWQAAQLSELEVRAAGESSLNLALGKALTASSSTQVYLPANANDGNAASYWESVNKAMPQWIQADLGASVRVDRVVLRLPESWGARTQTLKIQGSANGSDHTDLTAPKGYDFNAAGGNAVTITFDAATTRYVRVLISANTVQPGGQLSELEIYGPRTGDTQAPTAPPALAYTEPATGRIELTWQPATDNVGVTGYDVYADDQLRTSVAGDVTTYTDTQPTDIGVTYYVRAKDAAGNQSPNSNSVTRPGETGDTQAPTAPGSLTFTEPAADQVKLSWQASTDNVGVTGYEVYANNVLRTTVAGSATTFTDTQPATSTVGYFVRAKDAAGNRSGSTPSSRRTPTTTAPPHTGRARPAPTRAP